MPDRRFLLGALRFATTVLLLLSCGGNVTPTEVCGTGTHDENGQCVANQTVLCGRGTHIEKGECVANSPEADASMVDSSNGDASNFDAGTDAGTDADAGVSIDVDAACLGTSNIFVIAGNSYVYGGPPLIIQGGAGWEVEIVNVSNGLPSYIRVNIGQNWTTEFSTSSLGQPIAPALYTNAQRALFTDPGHPGLDVWGRVGNGCTELTGQFRVLEMTTALSDAGTPILKSFTATYQQQCEGSAQGANVGCVHVAQ